MGSTIQRSHQSLAADVVSQSSTNILLCASVIQCPPAPSANRFAAQVSTRPSSTMEFRRALLKTLNVVWARVSVTSGENAGRCECQGNNACGVPAADMKACCPGACLYEDCANNCGGDDTDGGTGQVGRCDRFTGLCSCSPSAVFNGPECLIPSRGVAAGEQKIDEMVWTSSMDKWGWSTCSPGTLLIGMKTDMKQSKDALYNLDSGLCQQPWEAGSKISNALHTSRCYHENWWKKFDTRGGKFCRRNYFVAGLFRSHCNSLYCIEMAKCCQVKRSMWTDCKWTSTKGWNANANGFQVAGNQGFVVGFFRGAEHTLAGITSVRQCTPIWYGQLFKMKTRFDN